VFFWRPAIDRYFSYNVYLLANKLMMMMMILSLLYVEKFTSFCQVLKKMHKKKIGSFFLPHGVQQRIMLYKRALQSSNVILLTPDMGWVGLGCTAL